MMHSMRSSVHGKMDRLSRKVAEAVFDLKDE